MEQDAAGRQIEILNPLGQRTTTVYDALGRATIIIPDPLFSHKR